MTSPDSTQRNPQRHNSEGSFPERYATTIKLVIIGILTLVLLIPLVMIQSLINERQTTRQNAIEEITSKWGGKQTIVGPCFVIPYTKTLIRMVCKPLSSRIWCCFPKRSTFRPMLLWKAANAASMMPPCTDRISFSKGHSICRLWRSRESAFRK